MTNGAPANYFKGKIYSCKYYDSNGNLIRDYVPALDGNNVACLYDKIEKKPYYNSGTGTFNTGTATGETITIEKPKEITKGFVGNSMTYTPVEYIQSSGTQFIDTGLSALSLITTGKIEEKVQYTDSTTRQQYGYNFYDSITNANNVFFIPICNLSGNWQTQFDTTGVTLTTADTNLHTFITDIKNKKAYIDGTSYNFTTNNTGTIDGNIFLFCRNANGVYFSSKKVYYTKIYNNDVLVRDFIPVIDNNNVACLYDKVEGKAYYNKGTGTFTAGSPTGDSAISGNYSRQIFQKGIISNFYSNIVPTNWSGSTRTENAVFTQTNTYGVWSVTGTHYASGTNYVSWKAVDADNNTYYSPSSTSGLPILRVDCPKGIFINPKAFVLKTQYVTKIRVTGIAEDGREVLLYEAIPTSTTSAVSYQSSVETVDYFSSFRVIQVTRNGSYQTRLYAFRIDNGKIKDNRTT